PRYVHWSTTASSSTLHLHLRSTFLPVLVVYHDGTLGNVGRQSPLISKRLRRVNLHLQSLRGYQVSQQSSPQTAFASPKFPLPFLRSRVTSWTFIRSLMNTLNNVGDKVQPCGTRSSMLKTFDIFPSSMAALFVRSVIFFSTLHIFPLILYLDNYSSEARFLTWTAGPPSCRGGRNPKILACLRV
ncbi:unnamed protein product, partial [Ectocarpus sp. 12 AP-2014]